MKFLVTGAGGGIGKRLISTLAPDHQVTGVFRRTPSDQSGNAAVAYDDDVALEAAIGASDVIVHCALQSKLKGQAFVDYNANVTRRLLSLLDKAKHRLFVYFSSQVVYSGTRARPASPYSETDALSRELPIDDYTRLKIEDEAQVIDACSSAGVDYLIVRPTVVMGPDMMWATKAVEGLKWAPVGFSGRPMNLIHVDDLCNALKSLIEQGEANTVFNLGDQDFDSADYFRCAGKLARRPMVMLPGKMFSAFARLIPSTMWFMYENVYVDCSKLQTVAPITTQRDIADYFEPPQVRTEPRSLEAIRRSAVALGEFHARGQGYSTWFNGGIRGTHISLRHYRGIIGLDGNRLTVKAGTTLDEIVQYLTRHELTLGTLPDFAGVSAAACFFNDVHGSSSSHLSVFDLIEQVGYIGEDGTETLVKRDAEEWQALRTRRQNFILTQVTFACVPQRMLSNRIEWMDDVELEQIASGEHRQSVSTTLHWFPKRGRLLSFRVTDFEASDEGARSAFTPYRGLPYPLQRALINLRMRGRGSIVGRSHEILGPWRKVPFRSLIALFTERFGIRIMNMELCFPEHHVGKLIGAIRRGMQSGELDFSKDQGIGIRFSTNPETGNSYVWMETTSRNPQLISGFLSTARRICGEQLWIHGGKHLPTGTPLSTQFVPR